MVDTTKEIEDLLRLSVNSLIHKMFRMRKNPNTMEFISGLDRKNIELIQHFRPLQKKRIFMVAMEMAVRSESANKSHTWFNLSKHFW